MTTTERERMGWKQLSRKEGGMETVKQERGWERNGETRDSGRKLCSGRERDENGRAEAEAIGRRRTNDTDEMDGDGVEEEDYNRCVERKLQHIGDIGRRHLGLKKTCTNNHTCLCNTDRRRKYGCTKEECS